MPKNISIEIVYQYRTTGGEDATPLWLDIDGCGDSEYPAPVGYSDTHRRLDVDGQRPDDRA